MRYLERYINDATGQTAFKRLAVREEGSLYYVVKEFDYGNGAGTQSVLLPGIKAYKTFKGAERAMLKWKPVRYRMTLVEGLMQEGKV